MLQAQRLRLLLQGGFFVAVAHQHEAEWFGLHPRGSLQQHIQRIGRAVRPGIAHHLAPGGLLRRNVAGQVFAQRRRIALPFLQRDAVGHDVQLAQIQPMRLHVVGHLGQHAHHHIRMPVGVVFGGLAQHDERMFRRHAAQLDR